MTKSRTMIGLYFFIKICILHLETPLVEKKKLSNQIAKRYNPDAVEKSWYAVADANSSKPPFVIVLPPPNVTGALHIGHALTTAIEDTIIRWQRMSGYDTLWVPGMDHAGIGTQVVVEKKIMSERGLSRHDIGREGFVSEYGGTILKQQRRLGASLYWSLECFTMDEKRSHAVTEAFVRLHKSGLIYRDIRLVNWDCVLRTAISDIEVEYIDIKERTILDVPGYENKVEFGIITSFAYPLEGGSGEIIVATTRVETMLGDTAIALHPKDSRYTHLHGKHAIHPFDGGRIPIICDDVLVDPDVGTGVVKFVNILTDDGKINSNAAPEFVGLPRFKAREAVTKALQKKGLYRGCKNNEMRLGVCSRSKRCCGAAYKTPMSGRDGLRIFGIGAFRDNCDGDHWVVAKTEEDAQKEAHHRYKGKKFEMSQDLDVLDTWFSSGLFPLSVLGWPEDTADLKAFYPSSVLETGHDILFFWVARMVMLGLNLGGDVPFRKVYLHPMVRDAHGHIGNLDPKERAVAKEGQKKDFPCGISECGADALRFALVSYTAQSDNINLDIQRVVGYRQWCNKLWNAIRFAIDKLGDD
ncbi:unnamed protein product [Rhodiola kirilowii]